MYQLDLLLFSLSLIYYVYGTCCIYTCTLYVERCRYTVRIPHGRVAYKGGGGLGALGFPYPPHRKSSGLIEVVITIIALH